MLSIDRGQHSPNVSNRFRTVASLHQKMAYLGDKLLISSVVRTFRPAHDQELFLTFCKCMPEAFVRNQIREFIPSPIVCRWGTNLCYPSSFLHGCQYCVDISDFMQARKLVRSLSCLLLRAIFKGAQTQGFSNASCFEAFVYQMRPRGVEQIS